VELGRTGQTKHGHPRIKTCREIKGETRKKGAVNFQKRWIEWVTKTTTKAAMVHVEAAARDRGVRQVKGSKSQSSVVGFDGGGPAVFFLVHKISGVGGCPPDDQNLPLSHSSAVTLSRDLNIPWRLMLMRTLFRTADGVQGRGK